MSLRWIYLFRHGETDYNREGRFQGHLDIPLNQTGHGQANRLIEPLREAGIEAILSSDLSRTVQTAEIVTQALNIPIFQTSLLREAYLGQAQGLTVEEMISKFGTEVLQRWRSSHPSDADVSFPDGETGEQIIKRSFRGLVEFLECQPYIKIGVSTHGGVIRRVVHDILNALDSETKTRESIAIPNGVIYTLTYNLTTKEWAFGGRADRFNAK